MNLYYIQTIKKWEFARLPYAYVKSQKGAYLGEFPMTNCYNNTCCKSAKEILEVYGGKYQF